MRATYYISFNGADYTQIYPSNAPKVTLTQEPGEIFFRWRVDSFRITATKNATAYATLASWFFDPTKFTTFVYYRIKEKGVTTYEFKDSILAGEINKQNSIYVCIPDPDDTYREILLQYDKKWQDRANNTFIGKAESFYYPKENDGPFINVDFTTFTPTSTSVAYTNTTSGECTARNELDILPASGQMTIIVIKNLSVTAGANPKMQLIDAAGASKSNLVSISANGVYRLTQTASPLACYVEVSQTDLAGTSAGSFDFQIFYPVLKQSGATLYEIIDNIVNGATKMNMGINVLSTILWNDILGSDPPVPINTIIVAHPTYDYVIESNAIWNDGTYKGLWLTRVDTFTTSKQDKIETSLKDIMDILKKIRVWWFIDEDGNFRLEHERYFREYAAQANITAGAYLNYKPEVDNKIYNYDMSDIYNQLNYSENNESDEDWNAYPVYFSTVKTSGKVKDIKFSNVSTDFDFILAYGLTSGVNNSGLLLLRTIGASYMIDITISNITATNYYTNTYLGWSWLVKYYYKYFAEADDGWINGGNAISYLGVKEYLKQRDVSFHPTTAIDWKKPFTMALGTGWLQNAEYYPETGMASINVGYDPYL